MKLPTSIRLLIVTSIAVLLQFTALAHTSLQESTPASGATVKAAPAHIDLVFNEPVRLIKLELLGTGHEMPTAFEASSEAKAMFRIVTPGMHPGNFTVNWAVIGADGHTVTNSYSFGVDPNLVEDHAGHGADGHGHSHADEADHDAGHSH